MVYPVHTEHPELYAKFVSDGMKVTVPQKNVTYQIGK